jgi:hypothetical protein
MKSKTRKRLRKSNKTVKRRRGGTIGQNEIDVYLIAYPRHKNDKKRIMYFSQTLHNDPNDFFNAGFVEDMMESMVKTKEPLVTYHKKLKIKEKVD